MKILIVIGIGSLAISAIVLLFATFIAYRIDRFHERFESRRLRLIQEGKDAPQ